MNNSFSNSAQIEYRKKLGQAREKFLEMLFSIPRELTEESFLAILHLWSSKLSEKQKTYYEQRLAELVPRMEKIMVKQWGIQYTLRCSKYLDLMFYLVEEEEKAQNFYFDNLLDKMVFDALTKDRSS
jgi:hypothetical protein